MREIAVVTGLAAGVATGVLLGGGYPAAALAMGLCCISAAVLAGLRPGAEGVPAPLRTPLAVLTVFLAGVGCGIGWRLGGDPAPGRLALLARDCCGRLCEAISRAGLGHDSSAALLRALLGGDRSLVSPETKAVFRRSGASHLLALSGLHLGLIYLMLSRLLAPMGNSPASKRIRSLAIVSFSGFYAMAVGAGPSIVRAFLFILLREGSRLLGRKIPNLSIFAGALSIQLVLSPGNILEVGFQLSYSAMLGIFLIYPRLSAFYPGPARGRSFWRDPMRRIWDLMCLSISCQGLTAPIAWHHFHSFPRYFLLTNLLAMPLTTLVMWSAVLTLTLSAAGICPGMMKELTDMLCQLLLRCLEIISQL